VTGTRTFTTRDRIASMLGLPKRNVKVIFCGEFGMLRALTAMMPQRMLFAFQSGGKPVPSNG